MKEVYYRLEGSRKGETVVEARIDMGFASHAFQRATEIVIAYGDTNSPVDLWTLERIEKEKP